MIIVDSKEEYRRTCYQVLAISQHYTTQSECPYIVKVDDDVLVRVPLLLAYVTGDEIPTAVREPAITMIGWVEPTGSDSTRSQRRSGPRRLASASRRVLLLARPTHPSIFLYFF
jgi:hypothetical protein